MGTQFRQQPTEGDEAYPAQNDRPIPEPSSDIYHVTVGSAAPIPASTNRFVPFFFVILQVSVCESVNESVSDVCYR